MASPGRLGHILRPLQLIWFSIRLHYAAAKEALHKDGLAGLTRIRQIRDVAGAKLLLLTSAGFIAFENTTVVPSLVEAAEGKVLELGPGPGNQLQRYDQSRVSFIYAVDPNPNYRDEIATRVKKHDLQDKYKFLTCGVEDSEILRGEGVTEGSIDTVLSIQVLCAVGDVKTAITEIWKLLKPGGKFVFWEHGKSKDTLTAVTQTCLNPSWSAFVGCNMNRDIKADILGAGEWENPGDLEEGDDLHTCLPRIWGVLIKKA